MSSDRNHDPNLKRTTDPALARSVIEERGGFPGHEPGTEGRGDRGLLRVGRYGQDDDLKELSWEEFAHEFEEKDLVFLYPEDSSDADEIGSLQQRPESDR